ncbi:MULTISPECIES: PAS domain-containing sensor histidine kinase [Flavobacteriaceae]|uniref:PAS domain-containing sensor histidine kinase n=1 Tax=Flavobacteriaceae TaxID=49546 RepID=UPI00234A98F6|nr:PAS domain-containing sensor histidine kinase [Muricauda sp. SP22]MDC6363750.1 PAS domain-containing sensor histidine kinase [Muricauda sp. SP22]
MNPTLEPFFNQSLDGLCIADYEGYFVKVNPSLKLLLGYSEKELKSRLISSFIHPMDREMTANHRGKLLKNKPLVNFENRYVTKSGEHVWLHWTAIPISKKGLIYAIAKDITHTKKLEQDRITHLDQLSKINETLRQQNYATPHDLRSPLNNLLSLLNLIDLSKIDDKDTLEILGLISLSAEGLKSSLNTYLDSLKQREVSTEKLEKVNFDQVFRKVKNSIGALIQKEGVVFNTDFSEMEDIVFKQQFMESIFLNLITNSIKYAQPGVPPIISIATGDTNGKKTLVYEDNGAGMDLNKMGSSIFEIRDRDSGNQESKGVGLYLIKSQITSLGGSIEVKSTLNKGTTFNLIFK